MSDGRGGLDHAAERLIEAARPLMASLGEGRELAIEGIGWATVELDRAETELAAALASAIVQPFRPADPDPILGAEARVGRLVYGPRLVLLEPNTEGRLAAFLAGHGEGLAAVYVSDAAAPPPSGWASLAGTGRPLRRGPLGSSWHLAGGRGGPHLVLVRAAQ